MSQTFNYRHLYYFWVVAKAGGIAAGAKQLDMAIQTVSAQIKNLEHALGYSLFHIQGRKLVLTPAGVAALQDADTLFHIGSQLPMRVREAATTPSQRLQVGIADGLSKLAVQAMLQPVLQVPSLRLRCVDGDFDDLLADLALHKLDAVLADHPAPANPSLKLISRLLAQSPVDWYGTPDLARTAQQDFPHSLSHLPVILPTEHAAIRTAINQWLEIERIKPNVVGEFEDSALLATFGVGGLGIFPAPKWATNYLLGNHQLQKIAPCGLVQEPIYLISAARKVPHPLLEQLKADHLGSMEDKSFTSIAL